MIKIIDYPKEDLISCSNCTKLTDYLIGGFCCYCFSLKNGSEGAK